METITFRYSSLVKFFSILSIGLILSFPFIYGVDSAGITFLTILFIGTIIIYSIKSTPLIKYISITVLCIKSALLLYLYSNDNIYIFPDSYNYIEILNNVVKMGTYDFWLISSAANTLHVGFYYVYLFIYQIFGNDFSILLINSLFTTLASILFYKIFNKRFNHKIAFVTFVLFNLSANMFLFGSFILKDPIVMLLIALSLYLYLNKRRIFVALILAFFLVTVRIYAGFAIIAAIAIDYLIFSGLSKRRKLLTIVGLLLLTEFVMNLPVAQTYLELSTGFLTGTSIFSSLLIIPSTIIKFFFAPLPWNIINNTNVYRFLILDSIVFILLSFALIPFAMKWLKFKELRNAYYVFLVPVLFHAFTLGVEYGGDSTRQRSGVFVFLILTIVLGLFYKKETRAE